VENQTPANPKNFYKKTFSNFKTLLIAGGALVIFLSLGWLLVVRISRLSTNKEQKNDWAVFYDVKEQKAFVLNLITGARHEAPKDPVLGKNRIFYTSDPNDGGIYSQNFDGSNVIKLASFRQTDKEKFWMAGSGIISISPNDSKILFILKPLIDPFLKKEIDLSVKYGYYILNIDVGEAILISEFEDMADLSSPPLYEVLEWDEKSQPIFRDRNKIYFFDLENRRINPLIDSLYDAQTYVDSNSKWLSGLRLSGDKKLAVYQLTEYTDTVRKAIDIGNSIYTLEVFDHRLKRKITLIEKTFKGMMILNISISPDKKVAYTYNRDLWVYDPTNDKRSKIKM